MAAMKATEQKNTQHCMMMYGQVKYGPCMQTSHNSNSNYCKNDTTKGSGMST
jgi:hypothetical protein